MVSKGIGIIPGNRPSHIDHLVPLCACLNTPILATDSFVKSQIELYYPKIEVILIDPEDHILDSALNGFDLFIYVHFYRQGNHHFFFDDYLCRKQARSVMSLHGQPDKFHEIHWLERLADEDVLLGYGPQLLELLEKKGIPKKPVICGNYRLEYYKAHEAFFDAQLPYKKEKTTVLYAPTWASTNQILEHRRYYTSFLDVYRELFETVPDDFQLIVKPHPMFLTSSMYNEIQEIKSDFPHILFLDDYPSIYPLLKQVDIYLGDYSSMGYDFLYFNRPLFFLGSLQNTPLQSCGLTIQNQPIFGTIKNTPDAPYREKRQALYKHVYGERKCLSELKKAIENAY